MDRSESQPTLAESAAKPESQLPAGLSAEQSADFPDEFSADEFSALTLDRLTLDSEFARKLPELAVEWSAEHPSEPQLLRLNRELARSLGIDPDALDSETGVRFLLGNTLAAGSRPVAQCYAGHQFGSYSSRLGDGRALLLGEFTDREGEIWDLHLKGSGRTPFARADGFAAVGPMLREYLMGEAMHSLGVPTTRALAVVETGRKVVRDELLTGAVLVRVASSHLRVGSFQYALGTGDVDLLKTLADFAISRHYPSCVADAEPYRALLQHVITAQAELTASWMLIGFVHGVMNTDNVTISGETIDYGPCAFLDAYDPATVFSSIDHEGRYAFGNQPIVTHWNLARFAETLIPLLADDVDDAKEIALSELGRFPSLYEAARISGMRKKLGLSDRDDPSTGTHRAAVQDEIVSEIAAGVLADLHTHRVDYTRFFRALAAANRGDDSDFRELFSDEQPGAWWQQWKTLSPDTSAMDRENPCYIPRNHLVDAALEAATVGDLAPFEELLSAVGNPYDPRPGLARFALPAPEEYGQHRTFCGT